MSGIFKNAHFGKPYRTRDGKKAIYHCRENDIHWLIFEDGPLYFYKNDGLYDDGRHVSNNFDIVSEWQEPIDMEELRKDIEEYAENMMIIHCKEHHIDCPNHIIKDALRRAYEDGYRKAMEEER